MKLSPGAFLLLFAWSGSVLAAPTFSVPGYVEEEICKGNGTIAIRFDFAGRLWATEKQGRILVFEPGDSSSGYNYEYYEKEPARPSWDEMPDFDKLTPVRRGVTTNLSLDRRNRNDDFAFRFTGTLTIPSEGSYTFYLDSDDGSRLHIDNQLIVEHRRGGESKGEAKLYAGRHAVKVEYFEAGGGESLRVEYEGPNIPKGPLVTGPFRAPRIFADLGSQVNSNGERGLLGLALDPNFKVNRFLYVFYSTDQDQRLVRLTANSDYSTMVPGSEKILVNGLPNLNPVHKAGDIAFHPRDPGSIYVMVGDDGDRNKVADLSCYWGKLLKVNASDGAGLSSNPFFDGDTRSVQSRVWAHSFRNPFRFTFDPAAPIADAMYVSENGDGTDRTLFVLKGADGGWPSKFTDDATDGRRKILNTSPPAKTAIAIVRDGPLAGPGPVLYNARYGGGDRSEIRRWRLTGTRLDQLEPLPEDNGKPFFTGFSAFNIVSLQPGPDGALYFTDSNQGDSRGNGYWIGRIRFTGGTSPVATFKASFSQGEAPLKVQFTDTSTLAGGKIASWAWEFGDGTRSAEQNPVHIYSQPGVFPVSLTVANAAGVTNRTEAAVTVYRSIVLDLSCQLIDVRTLTASPLSKATELRFYQADGATPMDKVSVPAGGVFRGSVPLRITGPAVVISAGEPATDGVQAAYVGVPLSVSHQRQAIQVAFRLSDTLVRGRVTDTLKRPAPVDLGLSGNVPGYSGFPGGRDYLPGAGCKPSGLNHRIVPDALGYFNIALPENVPAGTYDFDTTADTSIAIYGKLRRPIEVRRGETTLVDPVVGLYEGGRSRDDLAKIVEIPRVDFEKSIQPIFTSSCVACHNGIATNCAGLDLQPGRSLQSLVQRESTGAPGVHLVEPGAPNRSFLMEKLSCSIPQTGTRMRPGDPMPLQQQALIRDWIRQMR